jgi:hypothetical protein
MRVRGFNTCGVQTRYTRPTKHRGVIGDNDLLGKLRLSQFRANEGQKGYH